MLELIKELPDNVVGIVARGRVTNEECDDVLRPAMERSLRRNKKLRLYYEVGSRFPGAGWDNLDVAIDHLPQWERIAVVTDTQWRLFCERFGLEALAADPALDTQDRRRAERGRVIPIVAEALGRYTKAELMTRCEALGLPFAPIAQPWDLFDDPHDQWMAHERLGVWRAGEQAAEPLGPVAVKSAFAERRLPERLGEVGVERAHGGAGHAPRLPSQPRRPGDRIQGHAGQRVDEGNRVGPPLFGPNGDRGRIGDVRGQLHDQRLLRQRPQCFQQGLGLGWLLTHDQPRVHVGA